MTLVTKGGDEMKKDIMLTHRFRQELSNKIQERDEIKKDIMLTHRKRKTKYGKKSRK